MTGLLLILSQIGPGEVRTGQRRNPPAAAPRQMRAFCEFFERNLFACARPEWRAFLRIRTSGGRRMTASMIFALVSITRLRSSNSGGSGHLDAEGWE
jgi:hypothetical protein